MTDDDGIASPARAAELLQREPSAAPARPPRALREGLRRGVLRVLRPYTYHQRELDAALVAALQRHEQELEHVRTRHGEQIERLEQLVRELILAAESLRRDTADVATGVEHGMASTQQVMRGLEALTAELRAEPYMAGSPFAGFASPVGEVVGFRSAAELPAGLSDYDAFEELFRGPPERVSESQRPYLALVRGHEPVLDVGCGRGDFLALLAAEGIAASGVDSDPGMVARCQERGLRATFADANEHLESLPDGTLGVVFSSQVIEHLPFTELRRMLALARQKLRPGGLFIAETVNPHRIASFKTFWVDLTHEHPIFPEVALALCAIAGFDSAYVFAPTFDSFEAARFDAPAYAAVAAAPAATRTDGGRGGEGAA